MLGGIVEEAPKKQLDSGIGKQPRKPEERVFNADDCLRDDDVRLMRANEIPSPRQLSPRGGGSPRGVGRKPSKEANKLSSPRGGGSPREVGRKPSKESLRSPGGVGRKPSKESL